MSDKLDYIVEQLENNFVDFENSWMSDYSIKENTLNLHFVGLNIVIKQDERNKQLDVDYYLTHQTYYDPNPPKFFDVDIPEGIVCDIHEVNKEYCNNAVSIKHLIIKYDRIDFFILQLINLYKASNTLIDLTYNLFDLFDAFNMIKERTIKYEYPVK